MRDVIQMRLGSAGEGYFVHAEEDLVNDPMHANLFASDGSLLPVTTTIITAHAKAASAVVGGSSPQGAASPPLLSSPPPLSPASTSPELSDTPLLSSSPSSDNINTRRVRRYQATFCKCFDKINKQNEFVIQPQSDSDTSDDEEDRGQEEDESSNQTSAVSKPISMGPVATVSRWFSSKFGRRVRFLL